MRHTRLRHVCLAGAAIALLGTALAVPAHAIVSRGDRDDAALLALGQRFQATGKVEPDGSATLIAPSWVVTAGHVARGMQAGKNRVFFGGEPYLVKRVVMHPECTFEGHRPPAVDIALLELAKPVANIKPVNLYRDSDEVGKNIVVAGFGDRGDGTNRPSYTDGKLRGATNVIDRVGPNRIFFDFSKPPEGTDLEGVSGPGDSGGPAYVEDEGKTMIVGVSSAAMNGKPGRYGITEVYTRISTFAEWIDSVLK